MTREKEVTPVDQYIIVFIIHMYWATSYELHIPCFLIISPSNFYSIELKKTKHCLNDLFDSYFFSCGVVKVQILVLTIVKPLLCLRSEGG